ncbi:hypothetical protein EW146_g10008 [Bondarzewia mesenterica]|uniref:Uncharacterized protein n=1 Tax=Bondarzewia mesenterica TaxID=1095465 RepID=A0A4S4L1H4_9AGAM|nr:hypothetical protein EW146_g10008 [Bondarzewia mesenterica]
MADTSACDTFTSYCAHGSTGSSTTAVVASHVERPAAFYATFDALGSLISGYISKHASVLKRQAASAIHATFDALSSLISGCIPKWAAMFASCLAATFPWLSRNAPPYAERNPQGMINIPSVLLLAIRHFDKLRDGRRQEKEKRSEGVIQTIDEKQEIVASSNVTCWPSIFTAMPTNSASTLDRAEYTVHSGPSTTPPGFRTSRSAMYIGPGPRGQEFPITGFHGRDITTSPSRLSQMKFCYPASRPDTVSSSLAGLSAARATLASHRLI